MAAHFEHQVQEVAEFHAKVLAGVFFSQCLCLGCHLLALVSKDGAAERFFCPQEANSGLELGLEDLGNCGRCSSVLEVTGLGLSYWIQKELSLKG